MKKTYKVFLIAGEPSGDFLGAHLLKELKATKQSFSFKGVGGDLMVAEGLEEVLPFSDFSIMGFFGNLKKTYRLWRHIDVLEKLLKEEKPDLLITIDFPGFNFHLGKRLKGSGIRHLHYGAPTVWAWRSNRAKKVSKFLDHLMTLFPFEPPYFEKHGLATTFVGHPLMEQLGPLGDGERFRKSHGIDPHDSVLLVLPGSRASEIKTLVPIFQKTVQQLQTKGRRIWIVIPTLEAVKALIPEQGWGDRVVMLTDLQEKNDAYAAATVALAASGTIALELALAQVPMVIAYRVGFMTSLVLLCLLKTPYVCMVNILLRRPIVPELLQGRCTPDRLSQALRSLLLGDFLRDKQKKAFSRLPKMLSCPPGTPSQNAAKVVMDLLKTSKDVSLANVQLRS